MKLEKPDTTEPTRSNALLTNLVNIEPIRYGATWIVQVPTLLGPSAKFARSRTARKMFCLDPDHWALGVKFHLMPINGPPRKIVVVRQLSVP